MINIPKKIKQDINGEKKVWFVKNIRRGGEYQDQLIEKIEEWREGLGLDELDFISIFKEE